MLTEKKYLLPELPYPSNGLTPFLSEEQISIHYSKHHTAYVSGANGILKKMDEQRNGRQIIDTRSSLRSLSFNMAGFFLHNLYWNSLAAANNDSKPSSSFIDNINNNFGSFDNFKSEMINAAMTVEGSGWAVLSYDPSINKLFMMQIEKHNLYVVPGTKLLMAIDVFEHAYYIDYKNDRAKYLENIWQIIDWKKIEERFYSVVV